MADGQNRYDVTATFAKWLHEQVQSNAPAVVLLYRSQPADPKRQVPEKELDDIAAACGENDLAFAAVNTRMVDKAFDTLEVQPGTPKVVFVRGGKGAGTTLLNPRLAPFEDWIEDRLKP